eukprot:scpid77698/ scgid26534/ 
MIDLEDAQLLVQAILVLLKYFGIAPPVTDRQINALARRVFPALAKNRAAQSAVLWLKEQCEDGVVRVASAWEVVRRLLEINKHLFWSMALELCSGLHPSEWLEKARVVVGQLRARSQTSAQPSARNDKQASSEGCTGTEKERDLILPYSKL